MAEQAFNDVQILVGDYDFSGAGNSLEMTYGAEIIEATPFNLGFRNRIPGYETLEGSMTGFLNDTAAHDEYLYDNIGIRDVPLSIAPNTGSEGDLAYLTTHVLGQYNFGGGVGEPGPFTFEFSAAGTGVRLVRGYVMDEGAKTGTGTSTGVQVGAVAADETFYAALHVTAFNATSMDLKIERDDNSGFTSAADMLTFTTVTGTTSEWKLVAGAQTDDWYRVNITAFTGTSATIFVTAGIK
jgi:hypothetical protein